MNLGDPELLELNALCNALVDGVITDADKARLEEMLRASEDARRFYVRALALSSSLMQYAGEMQAEAPDLPAGKSRIVHSAAWIWSLGSLAAAASIVLAFWLGWTKERVPMISESIEIADTSPESDESVARLSGAKDCRWSGLAIQPGEELHRGQQIKLESGFAEITFDCGAQVTLEGPAALDLDSAWEAVLQRGTLKAIVPAEAVGFRVSNPSVNVVDLGTEFSMVADENGATEVFVLKGAVETTARDAAGHEERPVVLREKQARRFAHAGGSEVRDREAKLEKFMRKVAFERMARPANYVHWTFDETSGDLAAASIPGLEAKLQTSADSTLAAAHAGGHLQGALQLDGRLFARAAFPGIRQRAARTVAFWINVPTDASLPEADAMLAWPLGNAGRSVRIGWNRNPTQGVLGALRTDAGRNGLVGGTELRDGHWHHLAIVLSPKVKADRAEKSEGPLQLRQYVDGRLETASFKHTGKRAKGVETQVASAEDALWIGRAVDDASGARFRGTLDELFVADAALTPQEIRHLMRENKPATPEMLAAQ
ncbi:MAG: LamG-like jellyroll fold domain-containing protein [Chthoniobacter sp.]|uniref:LamG-like jellyroll fold domain-containing protein n=1 Tax=Chthoniobacter sp. TaxID=2510640 RepID=UPI0032A75DBA